MGRLTREAITAANKWDIKPVVVKDWGGEVLIRNLDGAEGSKLVKMAGKSDAERDDIGVMIQAIIASVCDENGSLILGGEGVAEMLRGKPFRVLNELSASILEHNGLTGSEDDAEKN